MSVGFEIGWIIVALLAGAAMTYAWLKRDSRKASISQSPMPHVPEPSPAAPEPTVITGSINVSRPARHTVEGLEIQYGPRGLVRSVRVGAMNAEHKELLLTMDEIAWRTLPNSHKQEVLAAARSTWAAKMCPDGTDIAYVIVKTECGDVVGRADPHSLTIL